MGHISLEAVAYWKGAGNAGLVLRNKTGLGVEPEELLLGWGIN